MVDLSLESDSRLERLAVVIDVRSRLFTGDLGWVLTELESKPVHTRVLYLDASDEVLVRRFEQVRRSHPLSGGRRRGHPVGGHRRRARSAREGEGRRGSGDRHVVPRRPPVAAEDRGRVRRRENRTMQVTVQSFGFKYGLPMDADLVCDVRFLPNPHWIPELRPHTGQSADVRDYVLSQDGAEDYLATYHHLLDLTIAGYRREGKRYMTIAVGCTGGKHRSVAMSEAWPAASDRTPG